MRLLQKSQPGLHAIANLINRPWMTREGSVSYVDYQLCREYVFPWLNNVLQMSLRNDYH